MPEVETARTGPSVEPGDVWRWNNRTICIDKLLAFSEVLYAQCTERRYRGLCLVPVASLLEDGHKDGYQYPETLTCRTCGTSATGTEIELEAAGWWIIGMGGGPLCPDHSS